MPYSSFLKNSSLTLSFIHHTHVHTLHRSNAFVWKTSISALVALSKWNNAVWNCTAIPISLKEWFWTSEICSSQFPCCRHWPSTYSCSDLPVVWRIRHFSTGELQMSSKKYVSYDILLLFSNECLWDLWISHTAHYWIQIWNKGYIRQIIYFWEMEWTFLSCICLQKKTSHESDIRANTSGSEVKVLILASIFFFMYLTVMLTISLYFWRAESFSSDIQAHFECEAKGRQSGSECSRESFNSLHFIFYTIIYVLPSNYPIVLIIYIVDFSSLKKCLVNRILKNHCHICH